MPLKTPRNSADFALRSTQYAVSLYCLIPAKPHPEAKSRLDPLLTAAQRIDLSRWLLRRTVGLACEAVGRVVVVSRDPAVLSEACWKYDSRTSRTPATCGRIPKSTT